jgi:ribosome-binding factor A
MFGPKLHEIKRERKKSLFFREMSQIVNLISCENPNIQKVYVTRVDFSQDYGILYVYLATFNVYSRDVFDKVLGELILYKPSIRKELASRLNPRYTPDIVFMYDEHKEKQDHINELLDKVSADFKK